MSIARCLSWLPGVLGTPKLDIFVEGTRLSVKDPSMSVYLGDYSLYANLDYFRFRGPLALVDLHLRTMPIEMDIEERGIVGLIDNGGVKGIIITPGSGQLEGAWLVYPHIGTAVDLTDGMGRSSRVYNYSSSEYRPKASSGCLVGCLVEGDNVIVMEGFKIRIRVPYGKRVHNLRPGNDILIHRRLEDTPSHQFSVDDERKKAKAWKKEMADIYPRVQETCYGMHIGATEHNKQHLSDWRDYLSQHSGPLLDHGITAYVHPRNGKIVVWGESYPEELRYPMLCAYPTIVVGFDTNGDISVGLGGEGVSPLSDDAREVIAQLPALWRDIRKET